MAPGLKFQNKQERVLERTIDLTGPQVAESSSERHRGAETRLASAASREERPSKAQEEEEPGRSVIFSETSSTTHIGELS